ncbi:MAG: UDP-4-amino-4,6-dideoxy-N-acetyl-beta-L-altrosamine transaminase [Acidobacteriota bacterium]
MSSRLALQGGKPVREAFLPYGRPWLGDGEIDQVSRVLRSEWLTTGPDVDAFETQFSRLTGALHAVAVSSGTAALHACVKATGIGEGDEVIVPSMTFAATANAVVFQGGRPVFADVLDDTLLIDPRDVERRITQRTKAVIPVDYAGQPCDYGVLHDLARSHSLFLIADACHSLGAGYRDVPVGTLARATAFSMHPVKLITSGEGGVVTTDEPDLARTIRRFRNHGIDQDHRQRMENGTWFYEMVDLGFNYRLTDFQCALARVQLERAAAYISRRREIAGRYDEAFREIAGVRLPGRAPWANHAHHLYVIRLDPNFFRASRDQIFKALRAEGIGVNVHYIPVHLHPYYQKRFGTRPGDCPVAEKAYSEIISLPIFPAMTERDVCDVIEAVRKVTHAYRSH